MGRSVDWVVCSFSSRSHLNLTEWWMRRRRRTFDEWSAGGKNSESNNGTNLELMWCLIVLLNFAAEFCCWILVLNSGNEFWWQLLLCLNSMFYWPLRLLPHPCLTATTPRSTSSSLVAVTFPPPFFSSSRRATPLWLRHGKVTISTSHEWGKLTIMISLLHIILLPFTFLKLQDLVAICRFICKVQCLLMLTFSTSVLTLGSSLVSVIKHSKKLSKIHNSVSCLLSEEEKMFYSHIHLFSTLQTIYVVFLKMSKFSLSIISL